MRSLACVACMGECSLGRRCSSSVSLCENTENRFYTNVFYNIMYFYIKPSYGSLVHPRRTGSGRLRHTPCLG